MPKCTLLINYLNIDINPIYNIRTSEQSNTWRFGEITEKYKNKFFFNLFYVSKWFKLDNSESRIVFRISNIYTFKHQPHKIVKHTQIYLGFLSRTYQRIYLGFLSRAFTIHRTAWEGGGYLFNSSLQLPPASQTFRH